MNPVTRSPSRWAISKNYHKSSLMLVGSLPSPTLLRSKRKKKKTNIFISILDSYFGRHVWWSLCLGSYLKTHGRTILYWAEYRTQYLGEFEVSPNLLRSSVKWIFSHMYAILVLLKWISSIKKNPQDAK